MSLKFFLKWLPIAILAGSILLSYGSLVTRVAALEKEESRIYTALEKIDQQTRDIPAIKALLEQHLRETRNK